MRAMFRVTLAAALMAGIPGQRWASAQLASTHVVIYRVGGDVTAPQLLPAEIEAQVTGKCAKRHHRQMTDRITMIVDEQGAPRDVFFTQATGTFLDEIAMKAALASRFTPGTSNGAPVPVWGMEEFTFDVCVDQQKDGGGVKFDTVALAASPNRTVTWPTEGPQAAIYSDTAGMPSPAKVGGHISAPVPVNVPMAHFTPQARRAKYQGICLVRFIVDANGMPHNARVVRPLGMGLDEEALKAVRQYRFRPAMKDGVQPVPVMITVEINFQLR